MEGPRLLRADVGRDRRQTEAGWQAQRRHVEAQLRQRHGVLHEGGAVAKEIDRALVGELQDEATSTRAERHRHACEIEPAMAAVRAARLVGSTLQARERQVRRQAVIEAHERDLAATQLRQARGVEGRGAAVIGNGDERAAHAQPTSARPDRVERVAQRQVLNGLPRDLRAGAHDPRHHEQRRSMPRPTPRPRRDFHWYAPPRARLPSDGPSGWPPRGRHDTRAGVTDLRSTHALAPRQRAFAHSKPDRLSGLRSRSCGHAGLTHAGGVGPRRQRA